MKASVLYPSQCILGEGPIWHAERKCCFWVDIERGILYEYNWVSKVTKTWRFDYKVTMVTQGTNNNLILGLNGGIARFDLKSERLEWLLDIETELKENRCNDGACDSQGRLWIGTMHMDFKQGAGSLYCIDKNLNILKKIDKVTISNGIVWSLDNKRLYYIDSPTQGVQSFIFKEETGEIFFEKNAIRIPVEMGTPDGMTIDQEGMLWIAHWGGYGIYKWNPHDGSLLDKIEIPAPYVTSCTFAGENLDHLVITTARGDLNEEDLARYPDSGNVFWARADVFGTESNTCII
ncbi:Sugar lactone lactonase YvrE [Daejeonella rubra]|uniref:Sugar lactone lactonase YvrE n=1 Tax=Daejeonella rubra TaxID=990371 RepID=A0A1G9QEH3_9SPHI|nr:SMP-30/gluconolactonase/LRE family protein [Daejeonella rubra]SDM09409.1 Sugar lactone lactonase YvrE [Daejeonella rubra]